MVERKVIIDKIVGFVDTKLSEMSSTNPLVLITRPFIARAVNNNLAKLDSLLKLVQDENGMIDVEGIMSETVDNLLVAQVKKYPEVLGGVEIGNDYIRMYKQWFPNLTEEQLDEKIIHSAINFWFEDEDAGSGKVWNYFKNI